jgi:demethoxyubiquinone hydroxylase (CLK1/Coq7/Cat5 family)/predicted DCC family thiol-disulfide oxidoreductase YuxK
MSSSAACTVYFDGACPLCRREIAHYRRRAAGADIAWVDASTCDEDALGGDLPRAAAISRLHVREADGTLASGASAFNAIWARVPGYRWLAAVTSRRPSLRLLELAYAGFLRLRPLWRRAEPAGGGAGETAGGGAQIVPLPVAATAARPIASAARPGLPTEVLADLRTDHARAVGAAQFYRGVLAVAASGELRAFAARRLATTLLHQQRIGRWLSGGSRSRLLPLWRAAGWATGALTALLGARVVRVTVTAVERLAARHYDRQIERLAAPPHLVELRATLEACRGDEVERCRGERLPAGPDEGARRRLAAAGRRSVLLGDNRKPARVAMVRPVHSGRASFAPQRGGAS